jgi:hypothetical protein
MVDILMKNQSLFNHTKLDTFLHIFNAPLTIQVPCVHVQTFLEKVYGINAFFLHSDNLASHVSLLYM